jgi:hypothetical protein
MMHTPDMRRLGLVVGLAVVLVAATPPPNTGTNVQLVTPTPVATRATMKPTPTPPVTSTPTATPRPTPTIIDHTPPPKQVLSDSIQFDGPQFCKLTSDASDHDGVTRAGVIENPGPMNCRITAQHYSPTAGIATISVPGNADETIIFKYSISGSTVTAGAVKEVEGPSSNAATITGTMHGVPGSATFYGNIKVWELSTAP